MRCRLLLLLLCVLVGCGGGTSKTASTASPPRAPTVGPTTRPTGALPRAGSCRARDADRPRIVAATRHTIVLIRPLDGKAICTLVSIDGGKDTFLTLSLSPDGNTVFFAEYGFARCVAVFAVEVRSGAVRKVADSGYAPEVSPDGRFLAYNSSFSCGDRRHRLVKRDLASGREQDWIYTAELGFGDFVWGSNPRYLIVASAGADSASYFLLDTVKGGQLTGPAWPSTRALGAYRVDGGSLSDPNVSLGGATVSPNRKSVLFGVWYSSDEPGWRRPIIEFDVRKEAFRTVIEDAWGPVDFDPSGRAFLYRPLGSGLTLYRYSDGQSVRLGTGYYDAAW